MAVYQKVQGELKQIAGNGTKIDSLPIGAVVEYPSDTLPDGWLLCNGQAVSRTLYSELFSILGTEYGTGDGNTTFNLPNYKGRSPVGKDSSDNDFKTLGLTGGEKTHKLTQAEMPSHTHQGIVTYDWEYYLNNTAVFYAAGDNGLQAIYPSGTFGHQMSVTSNGGNEEHNNMSPYLTTNFIIKAKQVSLIETSKVVDSLESNDATAALSAAKGKELNEKINKFNIYSTDEAIAGQWVDDNGKQVPLYRKMFKGDMPDHETGFLKIPLSSLNVKEYFLEWGNVLYQGRRFQFPFGEDGGVYIDIPTDLTLRVHNSIVDLDGTSQFCVSLLYTKRTDY